MKKKYADEARAMTEAAIAAKAERASQRTLGYAVAYAEERTKLTKNGKGQIRSRFKEKLLPSINFAAKQGKCRVVIDVTSLSDDVRRPDAVSQAYIDVAGDYLRAKGFTVEPFRTYFPDNVINRYEANRNRTYFGLIVSW